MYYVHILSTELCILFCSGYTLFCTYGSNCIVRSERTLLLYTECWQERDFDAVQAWRHREVK